jgi:hypothetical protein
VAAAKKGATTEAEVAVAAEQERAAAEGATTEMVARREAAIMQLTRRIQVGSSAIEFFLPYLRTA